MSAPRGRLLPCRFSSPEETAALGADQGSSVYPLLFTAESYPVAQASRRPVPFAELLDVHAEAERQLSRLPPGLPSASRSQATLDVRIPRAERE